MNASISNVQRSLNCQALLLEPGLQDGPGVVHAQTAMPAESREASAEAPGGLRRSGRVRTETVMTDYEAGTDPAEGKNTLQSGEPF